MTYFKVKTSNFAERWQVCTPVKSMSGSYLPPSSSLNEQHLDVPSQWIKISLSTTFTLSGGISYQAAKDIPLPQALNHLSQTQFLKGHSSAQFSSSPNQTQLIQIIKVFKITRDFQEGAIWSWLELNSAELRPSRNWVWDHCNLKPMHLTHTHSLVSYPCRESPQA